MMVTQEQITSFILALGLTQDKASQIHQRSVTGCNYTEEVLSSLGSRPRLNASAVFTPENTEQVASGVKIFEFFQRQFAIRGLGFTSNPGAAGIEDGVLLALEKMNNISLTPSKDVASLGPGNNWGRVYSTLESQGVTVSGGELAVVGISGLLTGNGFGSFLGSRGFSSADIANFEVVLSGGKVVTANASENSDLWWALKGGSNNFGIVTRFDMNTFPIPNGIFSGTISYDLSQANAALDAFYEIQNGALLDDPQLVVTCMEMIIPAINLTTIDLTSFTGKVNFTGSYPTALQPLIDVGPIATNFSRNTLTVEASKAVTPEFSAVYTQRIARGNINIKADQELYNEISELFFSHYASSTLADHTIGLSWNPVTPYAVQESNRKGGNAGGWLEVNQNSLNLRTSWGNADNDAAALQMDADFLAKATELARKRDARMPNQWMNNAAETADVISTYGEGNVKRMKSISQKYGKEGTFQHLVPGGYKLGA
ncbi:mitomycin radical oxidase [Colletotrichum tamarilloi]|uniref:Mitomycin radical oxidase n=1 Tax=Colletotrichum tamarilloi TaxID=1209934 RepID=A0ABQ9QPF4_9PEZI|nr:mitomycin radical oxidase [Colletotrichum tamarilloi]KAK1480507.1 mitomycin radical oxidase [Colletotrichum tamarilloi]